MAVLCCRQNVGCTSYLQGEERPPATLAMVLGARLGPSPPRVTLSLTQAPQITVVGIVTHDRVTKSRRVSRELHGPAVDAHARTSRYVVMDDVIDDDKPAQRDARLRERRFALFKLKGGRDSDRRQE